MVLHFGSDTWAKQKRSHAISYSCRAGAYPELVFGGRRFAKQSKTNSCISSIAGNLSMRCPERKASLLFFSSYTGQSENLMHAESILEIIRDLYPHQHSVVSDDSYLVAEKFRSYLPFNLISFPSGAEINGWTVPNNWRAVRAKVLSEGRVYIDAMDDPLGVGVLSPSYEGRISRQELLGHLFYSETLPESIPYHWANLYRPAEKTWALCVTKKIYNELPEDDLYVELVTEEEPGEMLVLDFFLPGESPETILINAHNCHPWQANDDLSGCAIGIGLMTELLSRNDRKLSYRLLIAPELIGPVHWLEQFNMHEAPVVGAIMLKSLGNDSPLKLQSSFTGSSQLDKAAHLVFRDRFESYVSGGFREIYGNDETVFDSPGFEIPSISLTRFPFPQYHTNADSPEALSLDSLAEAQSVILDIINVLEHDRQPRFAHRGLVSLSHPRYDLYRPAPAPGLDKKMYQEDNRKWNHLMNCLPRELDGRNSIVDIAEKYGVSFDDLNDYISKWEKTGLAIGENDVD